MAYRLAHSRPRRPRVRSAQGKEHRCCFQWALTAAMARMLWLTASAPCSCALTTSAPLMASLMAQSVPPKKRSQHPQKLSLCRRRSARRRRVVALPSWPLLSSQSLLRRGRSCYPIPAQNLLEAAESASAACRYPTGGLRGATMTVVVLKVVVSKKASRPGLAAGARDGAAL